MLQLGELNNVRRTFQVCCDAGVRQIQVVRGVLGRHAVALVVAMQRLGRRGLVLLVIPVLVVGRLVVLESPGRGDTGVGSSSE